MRTRNKSDDFPEMEWRRGLYPWKWPFARLALVIYTFLSHSRHLKESGAPTVHAQAHFPAQPAPPVKDPRISHSDENQERPCRNLAPARQGP
jgi:hypothetical protein